MSLGAETQALSGCLGHLQWLQTLVEDALRGPVDRRLWRDKLPPAVALSMMSYAVTFSLGFGPNLLRAFLTPLFGEGGGVTPLERERLSSRLTQTYNVGDEAAKREALDMLAAGNGEASPQVAELAEQPSTASVSSGNTVL